MYNSYGHTMGMGYLLSLMLAFTAEEMLSSLQNFVQPGETVLLNYISYHQLTSQFTFICILFYG